MAIRVTGNVVPELPAQPPVVPVVNPVMPLAIGLYPFGWQVVGGLLPPISGAGEPYQNCWVFVGGAWRPATIM